MEAAIIGGLFGLVAVLITAGVTAIMTSFQLKHDRQQRAADRALQAKRELLVDALKAANVLMSVTPALSHEDVDIQKLSAVFTDALATMNAANAVGSIETMSRGRDYVNVAAPMFVAAMTQRALLGDDATRQQLSEFAVEIIKSQRGFQIPYQKLVAAIRRDLNIESSTDAEVSNALAIDGDTVEAFASDQFDRLRS